MKIDLDDYELDEEVKDIIENSNSNSIKDLNKKSNKKDKKFKKDGYSEKNKK